MTLKRHKANASLMPLDDVALLMVRRGLIRMDGAAARAISGGAAPRLRQVGLALLRADLRRARRVLDSARLRGSGWYDWRDLPPHIVGMAVQRARRMRLPRMRAAVIYDAGMGGAIMV